MIARLRGKAVASTPEGLVLDVGGVGYLLAATASAARKAGAAEEVTVETYLHVREDVLQLYGFADREERELFVQLLTVNGVGPKVALAIVSGSPAAWAAQAAPAAPPAGPESTVSTAWSAASDSSARPLVRWIR